MTITKVKKVTNNKAQKRFDELVDLDNFMDACLTNGLLALLHKGTCTSENRPEHREECQV